jgi:coenzyme F420-0:L-glutamate ligase / coenzyme F420-1:gamma-L-glutamate ligase
VRDAAHPILEAIGQRRSIRRYLPEPVPDELVTEILTAATWAPSAHNRQPWRFAVVRAQAFKGQLAQAMGERLRADLEADNVPAGVIDADVSRSYRRLTSASVLIVICLTMADMDSYPDERRQQNERAMAVQSTAMAGQNLLLAAHVLGLGACWLCAPLFVPETVRAVLSLPPDWEPQGLVTLGYPAQTRSKTREPLHSRVRYVGEAG